MKESVFKKYVNQIESLTSDQFWRFRGRFRVMDEKKRVTLTLEDDVVFCGHCGSDNYIKNGRKNDLQRYKCKSCGRNFNQLTGTPLANLRKKGRWLMFSECLRNGVSVRESASLTGVDKTTAFRWRHRFLINSNMIKAEKLGGVVENLETKFKYSEKGSRSVINKDKLGTDVVVLTSINRNRFVSEAIIEKFKLEKVLKCNHELYTIDSLFCSENKNVFKRLTKLLNIKHAKINFKNHTTTGKALIHLNNAIEYNSNLHIWMSRFRGVATKYLHNYLSWYRGLNEFYKSIPPNVVLMRAKNTTRFPYQPITLTKAEKLEYIYEKSKT
jgi:transposase-like protein